MYLPNSFSRAFVAPFNARVTYSRHRISVHLLEHQLKNHGETKRFNTILRPFTAVLNGILIRKVDFTKQRFSTAELTECLPVI
jgi:hypothetical protein